MRLPSLISSRSSDSFGAFYLLITFKSLQKLSVSWSRRLGSWGLLLHFAGHVCISSPCPSPSARKAGPSPSSRHAPSPLPACKTSKRQDTNERLSKIGDQKAGSSLWLPFKHHPTRNTLLAPCFGHRQLFLSPMPSSPSWASPARPPELSAQVPLAPCRCCFSFFFSDRYPPPK